MSQYIEMNLVDYLDYRSSKDDVTTWLLSLAEKWKKDVLLCKVSITNEVIDDGSTTGTDGQEWAKKKLGNHMIINAVNPMIDDLQNQGFIKTNEGWKFDPDWKVRSVDERGRLMPSRAEES